MTDEDHSETCCHGKFLTDEERRCKAPAIGPRAEKLGNATDAWVWCAEHGGVRQEQVP